MVQHASYNIPDQSGTSFRKDLNLYLKAVLSNSSGATEPSNPLVGQFWYDTTAHKIKIRNSSNTAWTELMNSVTAEVNSVTTSSDTVTVEGYPASASKVANTLVLRDGSAAATLDVIGDNPTGDSDTIEGLTPTQLKDINSSFGRNYITVTAGNSFICGGSIFGASADWVYKVPFAGTYRFFVWVDNSSGGTGITISADKPAGQVLRAYCQATLASAPFLQAATALGDNDNLFTYDAADLVAGELVTIEGITNGASGSCHWAIGTAEYGWSFEMGSNDNLADVAQAVGNRSYGVDFT